MWSWTSSLRRLLLSVPQVVLSTNHTRAGVPDCEDAVYHPAMTALKWTAAALVALVAFAALADVTGPACVTDGDTLVHGLIRVMLDADALVNLMRRRWHEIAMHWPAGR